MPKTTAGAIIYKRNNGLTQVLLTKRNIPPYKNYWCLPGGHIEQFEEAEKAVVREVKEETNLDFSPHFLCYQDEIFPELELHNVVILFYGEATNTPKADPGEVSDIGWFTLEKAMEMDLAFRHHEGLQKFLEKEEKLM